MESFSPTVAARWQRVIVLLAVPRRLMEKREWLCRMYIELCNVVLCRRRGAPSVLACRALELLADELELRPQKKVRARMQEAVR